MNLIGVVVYENFIVDNYHVLILSTHFIERHRIFAMSIFNNHCPLLLQSLSDPVNVAWLLCKEHVIAKVCVASVESASPSVSEQRKILLAAVEEAIQAKPSHLQTFATALCKLSTNVYLGQAIQDNYSMLLQYGA